MAPMISYCVKEKEFTPSEVGSDEYVTMKNYRMMIRSTCLNC